MLIQHRADAFRLIRQHDHALLSGELAAAWRTESTGERLSWGTVLATALHDVVWREEDGSLRLDPRTGRPHDFMTIPVDLKRSFVDRGLERLEAVEPSIAALVRAHHRALAGDERVEPTSDLAWLRFFDNLSLFLCLTPPGSLQSARPRWLGQAPAPPPPGTPLRAMWRDEGHISVSPFPFGTAAIQVTVPYRDLARRRYPEAHALRAAWDTAPQQRWRLTLGD